jgi:hypothetical protein
MESETVYAIAADYLGWLSMDEGREPRFQRVQAWLKAIDAVKPDWRQAPTWAQWWAVDAIGDANWHEKEPTLFARVWLADNDSLRALARFVALPEGCDWRVMCYERPVEV